MKSTVRSPRRGARRGLALCALVVACALEGCSGDTRSLSEDGPDGAAGSSADGGAGSGGRPNGDGGRAMDGGLPDADTRGPPGTGGDVGYGGENSGGAAGTTGMSGSGGSSGGMPSAGGAANGGASGGGGGGAGGAAATCGNGKLDPGEACDDGNALEDDNCALCKDRHDCLACIADACDPPVVPGCNSFTDAGPKAACEKVYACAARTECAFEGETPTHAGGNNYCYCGDTLTKTCREGTVKGPCRSEIEAAFQQYHGELQATDPATIVNNIGVLSLPHGAALALWQCQRTRCGETPDNPDFASFVCSPSRYTPSGAGAGGTGSGGTSSGGTNTGGTNTGGINSGGASTGGTSSGGAGSGGTSSGGTSSGGSSSGGSGGSGGVVSYCGPPRSTPVADPAVCVDCEQTYCDAPIAPGCNQFAAGSTERARCTDVLTCIRSTNCIDQGSVNCYCGASGIVACKASTAGALGACKDRIAAGFPPGSDSATIVNNIAQRTFPAGAALALGQCDYSFCGEVAGFECVPYCQ